MKIIENPFFQGNDDSPFQPFEKPPNLRRTSWSHGQLHTKNGRGIAQLPCGALVAAGDLPI